MEARWEIPADLEAVHEYAGDKEITMMLFLPNETKEQTEDFILRSVEEWKMAEPHDREYVILHEGKVIGGMNLEECADGILCLEIFRNRFIL